MRTLSIIILFFSSSFLFSQQLVNSDLFGLTTETTFIFTNVRDSDFISKVKKISPKN